MTVFPKDSSLGQKSAVSRLYRLLSESLAVRLGETTVASTKVHVQDMNVPQDVSAVFSSDAGQSFYGRERTGDVIHIDTFHSEGVVDPKDAARCVMSALSGLRFESTPGSSPPLPTLESLFPYIDIQTAGGGGRLDGDLTYGQEEGVRAAHRTHVHIAALNTPEMVASLFTLVAAVEAAIENAGLQLRKVRRVRMTRGGGSPVDMSNYRTATDSLLRSLPHSGKDASVYRKEALARKAAGEVGSAQETIRVLEALKNGLRAGEFSRLRPETDKSPDEIRQALTRCRLAKFDGQKYTLTGDGLLALSFLKEHSHEIESYLRRLLWSLPSRNMPSSERRGKNREAGQSRGRTVALPRREGEYAAEIAVPETALAGGVHSWLERKQDAAFGIRAEDLRFSYVRAKTQSPIILLLDASASMAGRRIAAAKELARHLVLTGKDKVSVVLFQDSDVKTVCDFTRNPRKLESGLKTVQAMGLTPLARGLEKALELSCRSSKKPLVLCVTDGIPTVPSRTLSPIDDAILAARNLARRGIRFGCIGLEPNQSFLRQLVSAAKGTLYVVTELEASTLAAIARKERAL
jgi:magnesium chelatase subunit D